MNKIVRIDGDSIVYICSANKIIKDKKTGFPLIDEFGNKVKENKTLDECKKLVDDMIKNIISSTGSTHYILALTIGKNFRYDIYPEYKANRKGDRPEHFKDIKSYLLTKYKAIYHGKLEADDIVNICKYENSFIASPDSDILCLEGSHYDYGNRKWIQTSKEEAEYKFWTDMIKGQPGDNIKGIPGSGVKAAEKIMEDIKCPPARILKYYIQHFGEEEGIQEFTKNYLCLKIKDKWDGFEIPDPIEFKIEDGGEEKINTEN